MVCVRAWPRPVPRSKLTSLATTRGAENGFFRPLARVAMMASVCLPEATRRQATISRPVSGSMPSATPWFTLLFTVFSLRGVDQLTPQLTDEVSMMSLDTSPGANCAQPT
jgi:hypothetical protein